MNDAKKYDTEYLLFDSPKEKFHGGNGKTFSWELLAHMPNELREKTILAGGLNIVNIEEAIRTVQPYMVDVSSGVETEGKKDLKKIKQFIKKAKESNWEEHEMNIHIYQMKKDILVYMEDRYVPETLMKAVS